MIYHAGVRKGYSTFCPSCYVDCGKRTVTDGSGSFTLENLDPDLLFELLVIRNGYTATFVKKVDPSLGPAGTAVLVPRATVNDPERVVRGRVVDPHGRPMRAAVVEPIGVATVVEGRGPMSAYGTIDGLEPIAVTDPRGEFEVAYSNKATGMLLQVEARGMSTKVLGLSTGADRKTVTVSDGAVIRGRLVNHGKPVSGAQLGLFVQDRGGYGADLKIFGDPYEEIRIGTQADGTFLIANVPAPVKWYVYGKMDSIATLGATDPVPVATARDGEAVDVGDIEIHPGYRVRGKITLSDGTAISEGMRVTLSAQRGFDSQTVLIGRDGRFEFISIPKGKYEISPTVRGYQLPEKAFTVPASVDRDVDDFAMVLDPAVRQ